MLPPKRYQMKGIFFSKASYVDLELNLDLDPDPDSDSDLHIEFVLDLHWI